MKRTLALVAVLGAAISIIPRSCHAEEYSYFDVGLFSAGLTPIIGQSPFNYVGLGYEPAGNYGRMRAPGLVMIPDLIAGLPLVKLLNGDIGPGADDRKSAGYASIADGRIVLPLDDNGDLESGMMVGLIGTGGWIVPTPSEEDNRAAVLIPLFVGVGWEQGVVESMFRAHASAGYNFTGDGDLFGDILFEYRYFLSESVGMYGRFETLLFDFTDDDFFVGNQIELGAAFRFLE